MESLYETWLNRIDSYYEEQFFTLFIDQICQYKGGSVDGKIAKGKTFNAGYEVFIYAFFLGLYYGERKPLSGEKRKFRMEMFTWGRKKNEVGRKSYTILQKYVFVALIAKSNVDLLALDKGEISVNDVCDVLMTTLNEYANAGFYLMKDQLNNNSGYIFENKGLLNLMEKFL